ncbi:solute carrier family 22 member 14 isoform X2 [Tamandua tetradactyla]|uniref:solute carrier family 22 member 14 isoform X2 n=1 Tax=Tamandua tetradactyla TaxID=48850 RepID=UPI0040548C44
MNNYTSTKGINQMVKGNHQHPFRHLYSQEAPVYPNSSSLEMLWYRWRTMKTMQEDKFAKILDALGEFGTFQRRLVALTFIPNILSAFFMFADHFMFTAQEPYCNTSWILAVGPNLSEAEQLHLTLPRDANNSYLTCLMYSPVTWDLDSIIQFGLNNTEVCQDGWIYPESKKRSLINEFDLVCGKEPNKEMVQTVFMAGILIGSVVFGYICDKLGRYPATLLSLLGLLVFGFGTAFVNSFHLYLFFRFGVSQAVVGYAISSVSLATEWLVGQHRAHAIILAHCYFAVGLLFLTGLAYSLPHWRLLLLVGGAPVFPLISYIWILPESPRWLVMKGKVKEAKQLLCYAAAVNKKTIPLNLLDKLQLPGKKVTKVSILDFYSNRHLRKVTLVMGCVWFTVSYSYFTLSLKMKDFGLGIYLGKMVPGIMEVPARLCCIFLLEHIGRKWSLTVTLLQGVLMCLLLLLLPQGLKSMMVMVVVLGEFSLSASVSVFFLYTAELCPTVLRATGLGLVSLASAVGGISALTILLVSQSPSLLPVSLCCVSVILALLLCSQLPETQHQPLFDTMEQMCSQISFQRSMPQDFFSRTHSEDLTSEDSIYEDMSEEALQNTILNANIHKLDSDISPTMLLRSRGEDADRQAI